VSSPLFWRTTGETSSNPILNPGEFGYKDGLIKVGDGSTHWDSLVAVSGGFTVSGGQTLLSGDINLNGHNVGAASAYDLTVLDSVSTRLALWSPAVLTADVSTPGIVLSYQIPSDSVSAGTTFRVSAAGLQTDADATLTIELVLGPNGTTDDTLVASASVSVTTGEGLGGVGIDGLLTIRSVGNSGTAFGNVFGVASGNSAGSSSATSTQAVDTTVTNYLSLFISASTGTFTTQTGTINVA
jgi:hypothetical protein